MQSMLTHIRTLIATGVPVAAFIATTWRMAGFACAILSAIR